MKLKFKTKFIGRGMKVTDESGKLVYRIKPKWFSWTPTLKVMDTEKNILYYVKDKWFNLFKRTSFILDKDKKQICAVSRKKFTFKKKFDVVGLEQPMSIGGSWFKLTMDIKKGEEVIGTVKRNFNFFVNSFTVDAKEEDMPLAISMVACINSIVGRAKQERK